MIFLELLYKFGFLISRWWRRFWTLNHRFPFYIISVGNLTVGGTGKSVVVDFLVRMLGSQQCAVVLRGYKGSASRRSVATLVSDGKNLLVDVSVAGDEAVMHAQQLEAVVVVGKNRAQSCLLIEKIFKIRYAILDDAYQNYAVQKDLEVLLLDARAPFDNGHCLPLGRLREKDYSRAHVIFFTHADLITEAERKKLESMLLPRPTFFGAHVFDGLWSGNRERTAIGMLHGKRFLLSAGVGSIDGVRATAGQGGVRIALEQNFANHHAYTSNDIQALCALVVNAKLDGIVVTAKDWVKIEPLLHNLSEEQKLNFFVMRVRFEFLSEREYDDFSAIVHKALQARVLHKKESACTPLLCVTVLLFFAHFFWGFI